MKAWIGSQGSMRGRSSWVFWDREWRQAWRPAVALTAGTRVRSDRRPGAQKDAVTRVGRNPVSQPLCAAFSESFQDILYPLSNNTKSIRFQSCFIRPGLGGFFSSIIIWTLQTIGEELSPHIFSITVPKQSWFDVH